MLCESRMHRIHAPIPSHGYHAFTLPAFQAIARALPTSAIASARHSTSRSQLGPASPPTYSPAGATTPAGDSEAAQNSTKIEPHLPGHETTGLFGRLGKWGDDLGPTATGDDDGSGGDVAGGSVDGGGASTEDGNGQEGRKGDGDKGGVAGAGEGGEAAETRDTASWDLVGTPPSISGTATPLLSPTVSSSNVVETPPSVLGRSGSGVSGGGGEGGHEGTVVVFQLLMQRWELRPWVVVPRTLVATKEKVRALLLLMLSACQQAVLVLLAVFSKKNGWRSGFVLSNHMLKL